MIRNSQSDPISSLRWPCLQHFMFCFIKSFIQSHLNLQKRIISRDLHVFLVILECLSIAFESFFIVFFRSIKETIDMPAWMLKNKNLQMADVISCRMPLLIKSWASCLRSRWAQKRPFIANVSTHESWASAPPWSGNFLRMRSEDLRPFLYCLCS